MGCTSALTQVLVLLLATACLLLAVFPSPIPDAVRWKLNDVRKDAPLARPLLEEQASRALPGLFAPEALAFAEREGRSYLFTGLGDGRIARVRLRRDGAGRPVEPEWGDVQYVARAGPLRSAQCNMWSAEQEEECGRVLGLKFHPHSGHLYMCSSYVGIVRIDADDLFRDTYDDRSLAQVHQVVSPRGVKLSNALEIVDNKIYWTSSDSYQRNQVLLGLWDGQCRGRVMQYDLETHEVSTLAHALCFPNGIVKHPTRNTLLVAELTKASITEIFLDKKYVAPNPNAAVLRASEDFRFVQAPLLHARGPFVTGLPLLPDNIVYNAERNVLMIAGPKVTKETLWLARTPLLRSTLLRFVEPDWLLSHFTKPNAAVGFIDMNTGKYTETWEDPEGTVLHHISEFAEYKGAFYAGSWRARFLGFMPVAAAGWESKISL